MNDLHHPLAGLLYRMPRLKLDASIVQIFAEEICAGRNLKDVKLFGGGFNGCRFRCLPGDHQLPTGSGGKFCDTD
jgi:hypothetical protein